MPRPWFGRALDAAVARHVFGLEVEEPQNARTHETDYVCREASEEDWYRVAFYVSYSGSLSLESKLRDRGWTVKPWPLGPPPEPGLIPITLESGTAEVEASGASFEEALARAALKAVA